MQFADIALAVIAISTLTLALRAVRPITKKRHFNSRIEQTDRGLWDLEFSKEKFKALREDVRQQYDRVNENLVQTRARLDEEQKKETPDGKTIEHLQNLIARYEPDISYLKKQMEGLDAQIDSEENPESCSQKIEATRALLEMLKGYLRKL